MEYKEFGRTKAMVSSIGMGTYYGVLSNALPGTIGLQRNHDEKVAALRRGIELGMNLIDTAEVYQTEGLVGAAVSDIERDGLFIATKVWPSHLHYDDVIKSADASLARLGMAYIDLYQVHWPSRRVPIKETMSAMERLVADGKVRHIGVSNFSLAQMKEANEALSRHDLASNQVEYSLLVRSPEEDLLPYCEANGIAMLAYRPVAHGALASPSGRVGDVVEQIARSHDGKTPAQIALNWLLSRGRNVFPIPRASRPARVIEDAGAAGWELTPDEVSGLLTAARR